MKSVFFSAAVAAFAVVGLEAGAASAASLSGPFALGTDFSGQNTVGSRFRGQNTGNELYVGVNDLGVGANRVERGFTYGPNQSIAFEFAFDSATGAVTQTFNGVSQTFDSSFGGGLFSVQTLEFEIRDQSANAGSFSLGDLSVNGTSFGPFALGGDLRRFWTISGLTDLNLLVTGTLLTSADCCAGNPSESTRIEFKGALADVAPIPLPAAAWMLLAGLGGLAAVARRRAAA